MEFDLDFIKEKFDGALASFGKKEEVDTDERTSVEKYDEFLKTSKVMDAAKTKDQEAVESIDDTSTTETVKEVLGKEEVEDKKNKEQSLEKKLANIEKVIDKFSGAGTTTLPSSKDLVSSSSDNINVRPLDMGQIQAKANQQEYLKPSSVPNDRIALLYKDLEKYNLI
jgi:hypothetical protein